MWVGSPARHSRPPAATERFDGNVAVRTPPIRYACAEPLSDVPRQAEGQWANGRAGRAGWLAGRTGGLAGREPGGTPPGSGAQAAAGVDVHLQVVEAVTERHEEDEHEDDGQHG